MRGKGPADWFDLLRSCGFYSLNLSETSTADHPFLPSQFTGSPKEGLKISKEWLFPYADSTQSLRTQVSSLSQKLYLTTPSSLQPVPSLCLPWVCQGVLVRPVSASLAQMSFQVGLSNFSFSSRPQTLQNCTCDFSKPILELATR